MLRVLCHHSLDKDVLLLYALARHGSTLALDLSFDPWYNRKSACHMSCLMCDMIAENYVFTISIMTK